MNRIVNMIVRQLLRQLGRNSGSKAGGGGQLNASKTQKDAVRLARRLMKM
ncbi:MAG: hypothetical protein AAF636_05935 [Pseudomonadota bacterium]